MFLHSLTITTKVFQLVLKSDCALINKNIDKNRTASVQILKFSEHQTLFYTYSYLYLAVN